MPHGFEPLRVLLHETAAKTTLEADLTSAYTGLTFSTALHGGFRTCTVEVPMKLAMAWQFLRRENLPGYHFHHLSILEDRRIVWEGRLIDITLTITNEFHGVSLSAHGYYASLQDQLYDPADAGNTNWASGSHVVSDIIKEMLTNKCPDINSDQSGIATTSRDIGGIDLTNRAYPMTNLIDKLAPLSDSDGSVYHFAIWEDRKPYWTAKAVNQIDVFVYLEDIDSLTLNQTGRFIRNNILPVVGGTEGTAAGDADSQVIYPIRDLALTLPTGLPTNGATDARDAALNDRKLPRQSASFSISGFVRTTVAASSGAGAGALVEVPKWRVRAGQVLRIQDLVPASAASPVLDDLRTFFIRETSYDAVQDVLTVQPDRPAETLGRILNRGITVESDK
jgi:hypothetical protein